MNIGQRLREERERLDLSQERFAAVGGVQKRAQINYEAGERSPDAKYLENISVLGVNLVYVLTGQRKEAATPAITADEMQLVMYYREAQPAVRKAAVAALLSAAPTDKPKAGISIQENKGTVADTITNNAPVTFDFSSSSSRKSTSKK